jgi:hypothetical protein
MPSLGFSLRLERTRDELKGTMPRHLSFALLLLISCSRSLAEIDDPSTYTADLVFGASPKASVRASITKNRIRLVRVDADETIRGVCEVSVWQDNPELTLFRDNAGAQTRFSKPPAAILGSDLRSQGTPLVRITKDDTEVWLGEGHPLTQFSQALTALIAAQKNAPGCAAVFANASIP